MKIEYTLTPKLRVFFKDPFGALISGTPEETMRKLGEMVSEQKPPMLITVGDVVSQNIHNAGLTPQLSITDGKSLRDQPMQEQAFGGRTVYVENPQGTITAEAIAAVKVALETKIHTHIVLDGEEDLLVLAALFYAPEGAFVVYGQPYVGIVVAEASKNRKLQVKGFLKEMKASKS